MRTRIEHVTLLTLNAHNDVFWDASLTIEDDRIVAINADGPVDEIIDGQDGILMPGMVNVHTHLPMIPFRSLQDDRPDRLRNFLFPLEANAMSKSLIELSAAYGAVESLMSGVTTVLDMYYHPDACARVYEDIGLRALVGATIIDQVTPDAHNEEQGFRNALAFIDAWQNHPRIQPVLAPHGTNTVSEAMLKRIAAVSKERDIKTSMHVHEMVYEMDSFQKDFGCTPIERFHQLDLLHKNCIFAHVIYTNAQDRALLAQHGVSVAHCVGANTKAGKGIAAIPEMRDVGIKVGLGTDGPPSGNTLDLFIQMNLAAKVHKVHHKNRALMPARDLVRMATLGGAEVLGLADQIGSLEVGKKADLVLVETHSVNMFPVHDPYAVLVYSANASNVDSVWVDGRCLVRHKESTHTPLPQLKTKLKAGMQDFVMAAHELEKTLDPLT